MPDETESLPTGPNFGLDQWGPGLDMGHVLKIVEVSDLYDFCLFPYAAFIVYKYDI
jgi:hypothetical protein